MTTLIDENRSLKEKIRDLSNKFDLEDKSSRLKQENMVKLQSQIRALEEKLKNAESNKVEKKEDPISPKNQEELTIKLNQALTAKNLSEQTIRKLKTDITKLLADVDTYKTTIIEKDNDIKKLRTALSQRPTVIVRPVVSPAAVNAKSFKDLKSPKHLDHETAKYEFSSEPKVLHTTISTMTDTPRLPTPAHPIAAAPIIIEESPVIVGFEDEVYVEEPNINNSTKENDAIVETVILKESLESDSVADDSNKPLNGVIDTILSIEAVTSEEHVAEVEIKESKVKTQESEEYFS